MDQATTSTTTAGRTDLRAIESSERHRSEPALRLAIIQALREQGIAVAERLVCAAGEPDIVAADLSVIIEVKWRLTRKNIQAGCGQVLLYRQALNPAARALVIGYGTEETAVLIPHAAALGVEIVSWRDREVGDRGLGPGETPAAPSPNPQPPSLRWAVRERALAQGIASVRQLSFRTRKSRQSLYRIWNNTSVSVSVEMYAELCRALGADPGDWFRWEGDELRWSIQERTAEIGIDRSELTWRSEQQPHGIAPMWNDKQQFVFVETLAKLARARPGCWRSVCMGGCVQQWGMSAVCCAPYRPFSAR